MKNLIILFALSFFISCTKKDEVKPLPHTPKHPETFIEHASRILPGYWYYSKEIIRGPLENYTFYFHDTLLGGPITTEHWSYGYPLHLNCDGTIYIKYFKVIGSTETWNILFPDENTFQLSTVIDTGYYKGHSFMAEYKRVMQSL